jgi:hypothetical protein
MSNEEAKIGPAAPDERWGEELEDVGMFRSDAGTERYGVG